MPFRIGPWEIALVLVIILIVFGVGKLPQVGGAIGKGLRAFKRGQRGEDEEEEEEEEKPKPKKNTRKKPPKSQTLPLTGKFKGIVRRGRTIPVFSQGNK